MNTTSDPLIENSPTVFKSRFKVGDLIKYTCKLFRTKAQWDKIKNLLGIVVEPEPDKNNLIGVVFVNPDCLTSSSYRTLQTYLSLAYEEEENK